jgi:hypothetical protein
MHTCTGSHASVVLFHAKAGELHMQLVWPVSKLLVSYSTVTGHERQLVSPSTEKVCAAHAPHVWRGELDANRPAAHTQLAALVAPAPPSVVWLAPHGTQTVPSADHEPAAQETQAEKGETEPTAPAWPAVHAMPVHESCIVLDHVPAGHGAEATPPGQKLPGAQGSAGRVSVPPTSAQA